MTKIWKNKLILAPLALLLLAGCSSYGEKLSVGDTDVFYKDGATKEDAQKAADALAKDGYTDKTKKETSKSVRVLKPGGKYVLEMVVKDEALKDDTTQGGLNNIVGSDVATEAFGGAATELHFCDSSFTSKKSVEVDFVQHANAGAQRNLKASKDIKPDELKAMADTISKMFGQNSPGATLTLKKSGDKYVVGVITDKAKWEDKAAQEGYKVDAENFSKDIFKGAPVQIDLLDENLIPKASISNK